MTDYQYVDSDKGCTIGDGYVEGPDGSRAGLFWEYSEKIACELMEAPSKTRWGVYYVTFPIPIRNVDDLKKNFHKVLPLIKKKYQESHRS